MLSVKHTHGGGVPVFIGAVSKYIAGIPGNRPADDADVTGARQRYFRSPGTEHWFALIRTPRPSFIPIGPDPLPVYVDMVDAAAFGLVPPDVAARHAAAINPAEVAREAEAIRARTVASAREALSEVQRAEAMLFADLTDTAAYANVIGKAVGWVASTIGGQAGAAIAGFFGGLGPVAQLAVAGAAVYVVYRFVR